MLVFAQDPRDKRQLPSARLRPLPEDYSRVPARSQMAGSCFTGPGLLLQAWIYGSCHVPCCCKKQYPSWVAKHAGDQRCLPLHLTFSWRQVMHRQGWAHGTSLEVLLSVVKAKQIHSRRRENSLACWKSSFWMHAWAEVCYKLLFPETSGKISNSIRRNYFLFMLTRYLWNCNPPVAVLEQVYTVHFT